MVCASFGRGRAGGGVLILGGVAFWLFVHGQRSMFTTHNGRQVLFYRETMERMARGVFFTPSQRAHLGHGTVPAVANGGDGGGDGGGGVGSFAGTEVDASGLEVDIGGDAYDPTTDATKDNWMLLYPSLLADKDGRAGDGGGGGGGGATAAAAAQGGDGSAERDLPRFVRRVYPIGAISAKYAYPFMYLHINQRVWTQGMPLEGVLPLGRLSAGAFISV